jgi:uncharacterized protein YdhG (YjbR/CyaY superfamily)
MNMFKSAKATNVEEYLANVPEDRKDAINFLHQFIQKTVPGLKVHFAYNMLGYGKFKYIDYKGQENDWPIVALANQKNYISVYVCAIDKEQGQYLAEEYKDRLGKVSVGKSCIRFNKLEKVNLDTLKEVLLKAEKQPGLIGAKEHKTKKTKKK